MKRLLPWLFLIVLAVNCHAKSVTLSWDASPTSTVVGYLVQTSLTSTMENPSQQDVGGVLSYTVNGLENTDSHWFCVKAYDANQNESVCSNVVHSPPLPETVLPELDFGVEIELLK
jgi:hypothetical protein